MRLEFNSSPSANLIAPKSVIKFSVLSENEMRDGMVLLRSSEVRAEFDLSTSDIWIAPASPIILPMLCEIEKMKKQVDTC